MSRRPADKAGQNQQVIKNLLKLEANKNCADCKRNKHPRWASWNLGVFICIRCSGIHRGMGTHISRVKSVDLDAWTDEQLQSIMKWGNARANRYWESKLAEGHVPSDARIENFIRTKYENKKWVMDGPIPDPSTLGGDGDEDVPLTTVQEKARLDRSSSLRAASSSSQPASQFRQAPAAAPSFDLIGGDEPMGGVSQPPRASTTEPPANARPPPPKAPAQAQSSQLLGGLNDFLGGPPDRPSSAAAGPGSMTRPDLKQSILSLYASKAASQPASVQSQQQHSRQGSMAQGGGGAFGDLNDAFGGLSFSSSASTPTAAHRQPFQQQQHQQQPPPAQKPAFSPAPKSTAANPNAYAALTGVLSNPRSSVTSPPVSSPPLSGGGFFDTGSKPPQRPIAQAAKSNAAPPLTTQSAADDWGDFSMADNAPASAPAKPQNKGGSSGLLDFTSPSASANFSTPSVRSPPPATDTSVFNLSSKPVQAPQSAAPSKAMSNFSSDPWGGANEWATPDPTPAPAPAPAMTSPIAAKPAAASNDFGWGGSSSAWGSSTAAAPATTTAARNPAFDTGGWGDPSPSTTTAAASSNFGGFGVSTTAPRVAPEEDFGGWGVAEPTPAPPKPQPQRQESQTKSSGGGFGPTNEDLFGNVWG